MARAIKLIDAPVGLFEVDGVLVLKTEYSTRHVDGTTTPDCYIVESGEHFWGGVDSVEERNNLMVTPVEMPTLTPPNEPLTLEQLREMDGEPAYWPEDKSWGIISVDKTGRWSGIPFFRGRWQGVNFEYNIEARGMEVYAYPPDHIDREALGCPYCTPDADGYVRKFGAFSIHDGMLETGHCKPQEIKYCPHCSRLLTKEALNEIRKRMRL